MRVAAPPVDVVDATGAGDSFDAGFPARGSRAGCRAGSALGCACGALSTRALGGTAGQPGSREARAHGGAVTTRVRKADRFGRILERLSAAGSVGVATWRASSA